MAFNPFEAFSIRSKIGRAVMAVIGIVVMLTFVLSAGQGSMNNDFFGQIGSLFGGRGRGEVLATGYGDDIRNTDLQEVRKQRQAAIGYLQEALDASYTAKAREVESDLKSSRISKETKDVIERFINLKVAAANDDKNRPAYAAYVGQFLDFRQFGNPEVRKLSDAMRDAHQKPDSEDTKALDSVAAILLHDLSQRPFVPVGELGDSDKDLINYILLLKKADQLGIKFSADGLIDQIRRETGGQLADKDFADIYQRMRTNSRLGEFSLDWLMKAVANEYRARFALSALEGSSWAAADYRLKRAQSIPALILQIDTLKLPLAFAQGTASALPGGMTPYEFLEFFKDRCGEHTFSVLEVPVAGFVDQVTEKPTEKQLRDYFAKYRGELPDPAKERPGFKEPRKVQVQYVTLDATAKRITDAVPKLEAASVFLSASMAALSGNPAVALATTSEPAIAKGLSVKDAVEAKRAANLSFYQPVEQFFFTPRDVSIYRPQPLVALLGGLAGYPSLTGTVVPMSLMIRQIEAHDLKTRVPFLLQAWLTPFNPTMANALGMPAFAYALNPKLPPEGIYLPEVRKEMKKHQRQALFEADIRQLKHKLGELTKDARSLMGSKPEKAKVEKAYAAAKTYLAGWLKERGLTPLGTKKPIDQYAVATDPDLKKLNALAISEADGTSSLSKKLFDTIDPSMPPFQPDWFPAEPIGDAVDRPQQLMWVSEEVESRHYNSLANANNQTNGEMSRRVEKAWKMEKARVLAQAAADKLAEKVRGITKTIATDPLGVEKQLLDLAAATKYRQFDLDHLAVLQFEHSATQARFTYDKPKIEKSKVLYPTDTFADQLLELRKQPLGSVTVLPDAPRARFFVASEVQRDEKTIDQFRRVFDRSTGGGIAQDPLYLQFALPEERGKAIDNVFARLRAEAKYEEKDAMKNREKKDQE